ncbi:biopolymer transporter ExbD [Rubellicoccus peritrichatus]|uniref:Biopolymer transporter ExbD n=1 Tax=Rubellicoccus peritrichatus TaxID=3080537 RepID=A0AAQ3LDU1_9BACT|nr:biopolymer transporter ExbD [Puniceicoccus sp. CR14]WOO43661.1 biopolymer transporter ExbD [Puniceicoccus sp. CR14]
MAIKRRKKEYPEEDFQMAPMIDMVFLLLVFFMCVSTLAQAEKNVKLELPESEESDVPEDLSDRGTVSVDASGQPYLGAKAVSLEEMKATITASLKENPRLRIQVRADQAANYGDIKKILKACSEAGAYEVIYATYQSR